MAIKKIKNGSGTVQSGKFMNKNKNHDQLIHQLKIGGIYKHYKGNLYKVLMLSKSADDLSWWVVYQCLYDNKLSSIWHRKLEDFLQVDTWIEGQSAMPRFTLMQDAQ